MKIVGINALIPIDRNKFLVRNLTNFTSELRKRSGERKLLVRRNQMTRKKEQKAQAKIRKEAMVTAIKGIRLLKKP